MTVDTKSRTKKKVVVSPAPAPITCYYTQDRIISEGSDEARLLFTQSQFGSPLENGRIHFSTLEALYLLEKGKILILDSRKKQMDFQLVMKRSREEKGLWVRYCVFRDLRNRGYIVKTALKFGADFRVYNRGVKPGEDHARWIVYPVHETSVTTWYEFSAKNRVAHSTKKRLLVAVVDEESDVTYWEIRWLRP